MKSSNGPSAAWAAFTFFLAFACLIGGMWIGWSTNQPPKLDFDCAAIIERIGDNTDGWESTIEMCKSNSKNR